jgi:hypothetical protein
LAFLPYIRDMGSGRAIPLRSTWLIWSVLSTMSFLSNVSKGATDSLLFLGTQTGFTVLIFLLSLRFGMGRMLRGGDLGLLLLSAFGVLMWLITADAIWALSISIGVSALGGFVTIAKTYRQPETETPCCWLLMALAAGCGAFSVGSWDPVLLVYPVYLCGLYASVFVSIHLGKRNKVRLGLILPPPMPTVGMQPPPLR